jgi:hypothetical protein
MTLRASYRTSIPSGSGGIHTERHMKTLGLVAASLAMIATVPAMSQSQSSPRVYSPQFGDQATSDSDIPEVHVWLDDASFRAGDLVRPHVETDEDAFVTVFRVTTDGEIKVLYPSDPTRQEGYRSGMFSNDLIPVRSGQDGTTGFYIREGTGNGFVFAVASYFKFNYRYYSPNGQWSLARLASASRFGSPFQIVRSFVEEITEGSSSYSMDYVMYDVRATQYQSRYASRFRSYGYDDYYGLCLSAFGAFYSGYCRGYYGGYYAPGVIVVNQPSTPRPNGSHRRMTKPLVPDPMVPSVPRDPVPAEGTVATSVSREQAAIERREKAMREARPQVNPQVERQADPPPRVFRSQPTVSRPEPRVEAPRAEPRPAPRVESPRPMPSAPARVEVRNEPVRPAPPPPPPP